jgi:DNA-binding CsgD family transcriptional regulator
MLEYISYAVFVISVGLTAFGIMLSTSFRRKYPGGNFSALIYYQIFVFAFGIYGLWGQAIFRMYINDLLSEDVRERVSTFATLQGFPFMILAWYMLIRFTRNITGLKTGTGFNTTYTIASFVLFASLVYFIIKPDSTPEVYYKHYYSILSTLSQLYAAAVLIFTKPLNKRISRNNLSSIAAFIIGLTIGQIAILNLTDLTAYWALAFILSFFVLHSGICMFVGYSGLLLHQEVKSEYNGTFESFCSKFEISPRESDIIKEICNGLTNKEISGSLFISVQTVKDHTHRIYYKTGARNRVDLIRRLKDTL